MLLATSGVSLLGNLFSGLTRMGLIRTGERKIKAK